MKQGKGRGRGRGKEGRGRVQRTEVRRQKTEDPAQAGQAEGGKR